MSQAVPEFTPRPLSRRSWTALAVLAIVVAALYYAVVHFYDAEGGLTSTNSGESGTAGVTILLEPMAVNAQTNQATIHLTFKSVDPDLVDADGRLTKNLRILLDSASGTQEFRFPAGGVPSPATVDLGLDGELAQYPFDTHTGSGAITADTYTRNSDGTFTSDGSVYTFLSAAGGVNGWDSSVALFEAPASSTADFRFARAFSTQVFALLLLALAVILAASTLVVAFLVATVRRRAEIGLMSWTAALLFALPALRTFMPNGPPIGASIDMYVYLWVMAGAILAAVTLIVSWLRQSGHVDDATAGSGGVPGIPGAPSADTSGE
jgi:hypothetical protein